MTDQGQGQNQSKRVARVEREIRDIVANFLIRGFGEPLDGLVTVTRTWVSKDLRLARAYITVLGGNGKPQETVDLLNDNVREFQNEIAHELKTKFCPKLEFFYDDTYEESMRVQGLIRQIEDERKAKEKSEEPED